MIYGAFETKPSWHFTHELVQIRLDLEDELIVLGKPDPISAKPDIWARVFLVVFVEFDFLVEPVLELEDGWANYEEFSKEETIKVIEACCQSEGISEKQIWDRVVELVQFELDVTVKQLERRRLEIEQQRLLATLPNDASLAKIQRYEAHISREFYKALHELQRLQAARLSSIPTAPMAVDIDIQTSSPNGD